MKKTLQYLALISSLSFLTQCNSPFQGTTNVYAKNLKTFVHLKSHHINSLYDKSFSTDELQFKLASGEEYFINVAEDYLSIKLIEDGDVEYYKDLNSDGILDDYKIIFSNGQKNDWKSLTSKQKEAVSLHYELLLSTIPSLYNNSKLQKKSLSVKKESEDLTKDLIKIVNNHGSSSSVGHKKTLDLVLGSEEYRLALDSSSFSIFVEDGTNNAFVKDYKPFGFSLTSGSDFYSGSVFGKELFDDGLNDDGKRVFEEICFSIERKILDYYTNMRSRDKKNKVSKSSLRLRNSNIYSVKYQRDLEFDFVDFLKENRDPTINDAKINVVHMKGSDKSFTCLFDENTHSLSIEINDGVHLTEYTDQFLNGIRKDDPNDTYSKSAIKGGDLETLEQLSDDGVREANKDFVDAIELVIKNYEK